MEYEETLLPRKAEPRTMYLVWRASEALRAIAEREKMEGVLSLPKYVVLSFIRNGREFTAADIAKKIGVSPQSLNETISALEKSGYLVKYFKESNKKSKFLKITQDGVIALNDADAFMDKIESVAFEGFSPRHIEQMRDFMLKINTACRIA